MELNYLPLIRVGGDLDVGFCNRCFEKNVYGCFNNLQGDLHLVFVFWSAEADAEIETC